MNYRYLKIFCFGSVVFLRLLIILLLALIPIIASSQSGTKVTSSLVPNSNLDNYPTHQAKYGKGGYQSVKNITARDAIYSSRRDTGMLVYVASDDKIYILKNGLANANWEELKVGGEASTDTVVYTRNALNITTAGYTYTFRTGGANTNYSAFINTYDNTGNPVDARFTKANNNIIVYPAINCKLDALIVLNAFGPGGGSGAIVETDPVYNAEKSQYLTGGSLLNKISMPGTYKIPFSSLNTQILPYTVSSNITIIPDTANSISGASTSLDLVGNGTNTVYFSGFAPVNSSEIDSFIPTNNYVTTYLFGKIGRYTYKYGLQDYKQAPGAPVTLNAPTSFTTTVANTSQINLSWNTVTNASSYMLETSANGSSGWSQIGGSLSQATSYYNHIGLSNNTTYYYRISSIGDGSSYLTSNYNIANATTSSLITLTTPILSAPTGSSSTELNLSWSQVTNNSGYKIQRSTDATNFSDLTTTSTGTNSYNNTELTPSTQYYYKVKALGDNINYGDGAYSTVQSATTSSNPILSSLVTNTTGDTITLTFNKAMSTISSTVGISTSPSKTISSITRHTNTSQYKIAVTPIFAMSDVITATLPNNWTSTDGGTYSGVTNQSVTNNVIDNVVFSFQTNKSGAFNVNNMYISSGILHWDFGDGTSANSNNPSHTFANSSTKTVTVTLGTVPSLNNVWEVSLVNLSIQGFLNLSKISHLTKISVGSNPGLTSVTLPSSSYNITTCSFSETGITSLDLTSLTNITNQISVANCPSLSSITLPSSFAGQFSYLMFQGCAFPQSKIDEILLKADAWYSAHAPTANLTLYLYGGTNAAPSGGSSNTNILSLQSIFSSASKTLDLVKN